MNAATPSLVIAAGELSPLQQAYQDYFKKKLADYGAESPADLSEDDKTKFFNEIKKEWPGEKENVSASVELPALVPLHAMQGGYLVRLVAGAAFPSRQQIVAWSASRGLNIEAARIFVRGSVFRIVSDTDGLDIAPQPGLLDALNDETPEALLVEPGDEVAYLSGGIRSTGIVKGYSGNGMTISSSMTGLDEHVALGSLLNVRAYSVAAKAAVSPTQLLASAFNL